jgi:hypothetical protein
MGRIEIFAASGNLNGWQVVLFIVNLRQIIEWGICYTLSYRSPENRSLK